MRALSACTREHFRLAPMLQSIDFDLRFVLYHSDDLMRRANAPNIYCIGNF